MFDQVSSQSRQQVNPPEIVDIGRMRGGPLSRENTNENSISSHHWGGLHGSHTRCPQYGQRRRVRKERTRFNVGNNDALPESHRLCARRRLFLSRSEKLEKWV